MRHAALVIVSLLFSSQVALAQFTQQAKLVGTGGVGAADQGFVALSGDGNTAIVGGPFDNSFAGAAWVFTRSGGVWTQQQSKLVGTGAVGAARQGSSVALSSDGDTAIVGAPSDNSGTGAAFSPATAVSGLSRASWSSPARLAKANPWRCPPTARRPSWPGLPTTRPVRVGLCKGIASSPLKTGAPDGSPCGSCWLRVHDSFPG